MRVGSSSSRLLVLSFVATAAALSLHRPRLTLARFNLEWLTDGSDHLETAPGAGAGEVK